MEMQTFLQTIQRDILMITGIYYRDDNLNNTRRGSYSWQTDNENRKNTSTIRKE